MDRAEAWLMTCETRLRDMGQDPKWAAQIHEEAQQALQTLEAVGALSESRVVAWRARLTAASALPEGSGTTDQRAAAEAMMGELLEACGPEPGDEEPAIHRFEGASLMLAAAGLIDAAAWDRRLRERAGWPTPEEEHLEFVELNRGGTQIELISVIEGPTERKGGYRVLFGLRFADAVSFVIDVDDTAPEMDWPNWTLRDDTGAEHDADGSGGSDLQIHCTFRTALAQEASWIEVSLDSQPEVTFRMAL